MRRRARSDSLKVVLLGVGILALPFLVIGGIPVIVEILPSWLVRGFCVGFFCIYTAILLALILGGICLWLIARLHGRNYLPDFW